MKTVNHVENEPEVIFRITELLIQRGKSQIELLNYFGLSRNSFTEWKARRKRSYLLYIDEIARYFDVLPTYLLRGEEYETEDERNLIRMYRILNHDSQEKLMAMAEELVNQTKNTKKNNKLIIRKSR